jgi:transcriptional regulator with XRE-family HTH domain
LERSWTQVELAEMLGIDRSYLSEIGNRQHQMLKVEDRGKIVQAGSTRLKYLSGPLSEREGDSLSLRRFHPKHLRANAS